MLYLTYYACCLLRDEAKVDRRSAVRDICPTASGQQGARVWRIGAVSLAVLLWCGSVQSQSQRMSSFNGDEVDSVWKDVRSIDVDDDVVRGPIDEAKGWTTGGSDSAPSSPSGGRSRTTSAEILKSMYGNEMVVPTWFDFNKSTEENYAIDAAAAAAAGASEGPQFVGKYKEQRAALDYSYHRYYSTERQLFHDRMIDLFHNTRVEDLTNNLVCDRPLENWIVFTAGAMGAGKGHTMNWLHHEGLFPLAAFVKVDPDSLRELLPETPEYISRDSSKAGALTQKEVGYIAEVLTLDGLQQGKNVLVDGSLKDADWYLQYIHRLRQQFPKLKIAIIHVMAQEATVLARCRKRAEETGRVVPEDVVISAMRAIPNALRLLAPKVDYFATFENESDEPNKDEPCLLMASKAVSTVDLAALLDAQVEAEKASPGLAVPGDKRREYSFCRSGRGGGGSSSLLQSLASSPPSDSSINSSDNSWRGKFASVWKMECALPPKRNTKTEL